MSPTWRTTGTVSRWPTFKRIAASVTFLKAGQFRPTTVFSDRNLREQKPSRRIATSVPRQPACGMCDSDGRARNGGRQTHREPCCPISPVLVCHDVGSDEHDRRKPDQKRRPPQARTGHFRKVKSRAERVLVANYSGWFRCPRSDGSRTSCHATCPTPGTRCHPTYSHPPS